MSKNKSASHKKSGAKPQAQQTEFAPDYYSKFSCIGPDCPDSCCIGWRVDLDKQTYLRYQAVTSEPLASMFRELASVEQDAHKRTDSFYAHFKMLPNAHCPFLQTDRLCMIQKELGGEALSETCSVFPRHFNRFENHFEYGLDVACPEAARLILLSPTPIRMHALAADHPHSETDVDLRRRDYSTYSLTKSEPKHQAFRYAFRKLILDILQQRELSLDARMLALGSLLNSLQTTVKSPGYKGSVQLMPILAEHEAALKKHATIEAEFAQIPPNTMLKLQVVTGFLVELLSRAKPRFGECILACVSGLLGAQPGGNSILPRYREAHEQYYLPFMQEHGHILENYLVNDVLINLFPFIRGNYFEQYRTMVFNLTLIQVILTGMAGHHRGLTPQHAVQLIQSFTRMSTHDHTYLDRLQASLGHNANTSFREVFWLLRE